MDKIIRVTGLEDKIIIVNEADTLIGIVLNVKEARQVRNEIDAILKVMKERSEDIIEDDTEEKNNDVG